MQKTSFGFEEEKFDREEGFVKFCANKELNFKPILSTKIFREKCHAKFFEQFFHPITKILITFLQDINESLTSKLLED